MTDKIYIKGYNIRISKTHVGYNKSPKADSVHVHDISDVMFITYSKKLPGTFAGAIIGLLAGNAILNLHDGQEFRAAENLTTDYSFFMMGLGGFAGSLIGTPQKIYVNPYHLYRPPRIPRGEHVEWLVDED